MFNALAILRGRVSSCPFSIFRTIPGKPSLLAAGLFTVILLLAISTQGLSAGVEGLVAYRGEFMPGVRIYALDKPEFDPGRGAAHVSEPTDADGRFSMNVKPGKYYLVAYLKGEGRRGSFDPGDYYCFYSGNPVRVGENGPAHVGFNMIRIPADGVESTGFTGIQGHVLYDDKPLGRCYLYVYKDAGDEFRGMGFYVAPVGPEGKFRVRLPAGSYYLIGRQRQEGGMYGPLKKNDKVGFYYANPVTVSENRTREISLEVIDRVEMLEEIWFEKGTSGAIEVYGTVSDAEGTPLENIYVLVYSDRDTSGKPRYISPKTGKDGVFRIDLYSGGEYYLLAREQLGGPPGSGEYYGPSGDDGKGGRHFTAGPGSPKVEINLKIGKHSP